MNSRLDAICTGLSILLNAIIFGGRVETLCYRAHQARLAGSLWGRLFCFLVDRFERGHCENAARWDVVRDE